VRSLPQQPNCCRMAKTIDNAWKTCHRKGCCTTLDNGTGKVRKGPLMSDVHIIEGSNSSWTAVLHIVVPDGVNAAGVNFRIALINSGLGGTSRLNVGTGPGEILQAELDSIEAGELLEVVSAVRLETGGTSGGELAASLDAFYSIESTVAIDNMSAALRYYATRNAMASTHARKDKALPRDKPSPQLCRVAIVIRAKKFLLQRIARRFPAHAGYPPIRWPVKAPPLPPSRILPGQMRCDLEAPGIGSARPVALKE